MEILVSGAGIGGLSVALCLQKSGHKVTLLEKSKAFKPIGAGLQCGANALHVFAYLGLLEDIEAVSVAPHRVEFRDAFNGRTLYTSEWGETYRDRYGAPYLNIHRADLHDILVNSLQNNTAHIEFNAALVDYQEYTDRVEVLLADGRSFTGDCLIAADGIKSLVRSKLLQEESSKPIEHQFTGNVAWRGIVPADRLPAGFMPKIASNFMGQRKHMVMYYLRNQQLLNFVGVVEKPQPLTASEGGNQHRNHDSWVSKAPWEQLKSDFVDWHPMVQAVINAMDKDQCYRWDLYHHKPLNNWSSARVTLLGDAAHATLPFMAAGAALAVEDARILQRAFDQSQDVSRALSLYQTNRISRTSEIQSLSVKMGKLYHLQNPWLLKLAFSALRSVGKSKESILPSYNANTIDLI